MTQGATPGGGAIDSNRIAGRPLMASVVVAALVVCSLLLSAPGFAAGRILVISSGNEGIHAETLAALRRTLAAAPAAVDIETRLSTADSPAEALPPADLVITIGSRAAQTATALDPPAPLLHVLLSQQAFAALPARPSMLPRTAIVLDQPVERQLGLVRLALPDYDRIALIASPDSAQLAKAIEQGAQAHALSVSSAVIEDDRGLYTALRTTMAEPAVLITVPDPRIYHMHTAHNVLLTAFRLRSPVLGYSAAFVRAGAVIGLYTTPDQVGIEAATLALHTLAGAALPPPARPGLYEVEVNTTVARSLGLDLPSAEALHHGLKAIEAGNVP